jgi:hypothetical protein
LQNLLFILSLFCCLMLFVDVCYWLQYDNHIRKSDKYNSSSNINQIIWSRRWQARPRNFTPSQLTASKSTDSIKLARIVIRNYVKMPKMTIFRHQKMHVRIELET